MGGGFLLYLIKPHRILDVVFVFMVQFCKIY